MFFNMLISNQKILSVKCILAGIKKADLAAALDVNTVVLSREITSKKLINKINLYFNSIDPEINIRVDRLLFDLNENQVNEPDSNYVKKM